MDSATNSPFAASVITDQTFEKAPEIKHCPYEVEYIWDWFLQLNETRDVGMQANAIKHFEITSWAQGERINLTPFERRAIRAVDRAFMKHQNSKGKETNDNSY